MASVVDICNTALSHLGNKPNIASIEPPEGSAEADYCARFWPIARDMALSQGLWGFATKYQSLNQSVDVVPGWTYKYSLPNDCLTVKSVLPSEGVEPQDYKLINDKGQRYIVTNTASARIECVFRETNPMVYSPEFVNAVSYLLASYLAMAVTGEPKIKEAMFNTYNQMIHFAKITDANQGQKQEAPVEWLENR